MATLSEYLLITRNLLQSPSAPVPVIPDALLTTYINIARNQVALDGECVHHFANTSIEGGLVDLALISIVNATFGEPMVVRYASVNGVRADIRPWDWFLVYNLAQPPGTYPVMSHQGSGGATVLWVSSSNGGNLYLDVVALPLILVDDTTFDHISFPWSDAVPFYAAWYAYMAMQRQADAEVAMGRYREMMRRAGAQVTSTALPMNDPGGLGAIVAGNKVPVGQPPARPQNTRQG